MTQLQCFWIFCVQFALLIFTTAAAAYPADSLSLNKSEQANYMIGRYVIGSGGIFWATSANQRLHATVGRTLVGGMQGTNIILLCGFWLTGAGPVRVQSEEPF